MSRHKRIEALEAAARERVQKERKTRETCTPAEHWGCPEDGLRILFESKALMKVGDTYVSRYKDDPRTSGIAAILTTANMRRIAAKGDERP